MPIEDQVTTDGSKHNQKKPTIRDHVLAMADSGDMNGVVDALSSDVGIVFDDKEKSELVRTAINAHAVEHGAAGIIDAVLGQALAFDAELLLCCQAGIRSAMKRDSKRRGFLMGPNEDIVEHDLPRLARLEDRLILLSKTIATTKHTMAIRDAPLVKPKRRSNVIQMDTLERGVANE